MTSLDDAKNVKDAIHVKFAVHSWGTMMTTQNIRTKWGRARFGNGRVPALAVAVPGGVLIGAAGGWLAAAGIDSPDPVLGFFVFMACLVVPAAALVYAVVVDKTSIRGAVDRPDESVEGKWYGSAASGSFTDLILVLGVLATVLAFIPADVDVDLKLVLPAVLALCFAIFGIRYLLLRLRG